MGYLPEWRSVRDNFSKTNITIVDYRFIIGVDGSTMNVER